MSPPKEPSHLARLGARLKAQTQEANLSPSSAGSLADQAVKAGAAALGNFLTNPELADSDAPQNFVINQPISDRPLPPTLPLPCVAKIAALDDKVDAVSRRVMSISEDLHGRFDPSGTVSSGRFDAVRQAKARLQELLDPNTRIYDRSRDEQGRYRDNSLRQAEDNVTAAELVVKREQGRLAIANAEKKPAKTLLDRTYSWIDKHKAIGFTLYTDPSSRKETSIPVLCEALETARTELKNTQSAEPSAAERRAQVTAFVESEAARGKPRIGRNGKVTFPSLSTGTKVAVSPDALHQLIQVGGSTIPDATALICWLHKETILEKLLADIPTSGGLSSKAKATKIALLEAELLDIERRECELIEASNSAIPYRADTDIRAFLGLA